MKKLFLLLPLITLLVSCAPSAASLAKTPADAQLCHQDSNCAKGYFCGFAAPDTYAVCVGGQRRSYGPSRGSSY